MTAFSPAAAAPIANPAPAKATRVTIAHGDGIGPEIMAATLRVLDTAGVELAYDPIEIGAKAYAAGHSAGIAPDAWDAIRRNKVVLKAPITTPQGGGYKSLNVTTRKTLGLFANVRPCVAYQPFVASKHPGMDVVIVRENEEDTYGGIEHRQTAEVTQCLKLITRPGCERIVRHAFEYARAHGRSKVTCFTKDNIMKATDGLFHRVFDEVAEQYADIEADHMIIDIGAAMLADQPERFDVIVTPNLYGDIISDIAAQVAGSVGLAGSANIGPTCAMFEAIHGSAPDIAGQDIANPSGLLLSAVQMLVHLGRADAATRIHNAWLRTIEDGVHTRDITGESTRQAVGTQAFADAVIERLGQSPLHLTPAAYQNATTTPDHDAPRAANLVKKPTKTLVGVDVFLDWDQPGRDPDALAKALHRASADEALELRLITNRGVKVWPQGFPETFCTDHWRCRFVCRTLPGSTVTFGQVLALMGRLYAAGLDVVKTEHLYHFDGQPGYSLGQGE